MKRLGQLLLLGLGFALLLILLLRLDMAAVMASLSRVGWVGFAAVVLGGLVLTACLASGLYPLLGDKASIGLILAVRQLRDSAGDILPFTQIGGIALGMRVMALGGVAAEQLVRAGVGHLRLVGHRQGTAAARHVQQDDRALPGDGQLRRLVRHGREQPEAVGKTLQAHGPRRAAGR